MINERKTEKKRMKHEKKKLLIQNEMKRTLFLLDKKKSLTISGMCTPICCHLIEQTKLDWTNHTNHIASNVHIIMLTINCSTELDNETAVRSSKN